MSAIKAGDLVMIVKPYKCCGRMSLYAGVPFFAGPARSAVGPCSYCGDVGKQEPSFRSDELVHGSAAPAYCLIKIDPPATGDSLPTRAEKHDEVPA